MRESRDLEYKESVSNTFLKTVCAFANYGDGIIKFGIADDGSIKGIKHPEKACLDIENKINDSIEPIPDYTLNIDSKTSVITLSVQEGIHKPYLYKAKAYKRNDSATIAADHLELTRLILEGQNISFEELPAKQQELTFSELENQLQNILGLQSINKDTLKTLELYNDKEGFNNAGALLADTNNFYGIDMARFGDNISIILDRETYANISILKQYSLALHLFRKYYQYEQIKSIVRETVELVPEKAFREAIANALVHRTWDIDAHINIAMFADRIEITSPGGLPKGLRKEDYLQGGISILRNRIIGNLFFRLHLIERFGTGIRRINELYKNSDRKPTYVINPNSLRITLPVMINSAGLNNDEKSVYEFVKGKRVSSSDIAKATGFGKSKTITILKKLVASGYVQSAGTGRGLKYFEQ